MILSRRVLDPTWMPSGELIVHRHDEIEILTSALSPVLDGESGCPMFMFGPTGVGKTLVATTALDMLDEHADYHRAVVNCWRHSSRHDVTVEIAKQVLGGTVNPEDSQTDLMDRIQDRPDKPRVVLLDEVDQLHDDGVLYDLYLAPELTVIGIANREQEFFASLDQRTQSRFVGSRRINLSGYLVDELVEILNPRVKHALEPGSISEHEIETIATLANGDARAAITILRAAAEEAESQNADHIDDRILEGAGPVAREDLRQTHLGQLHSHQRTVFDIVDDADGPLAPSEIFDRYAERVSNPRTSRTVRNYLAKMVDYRLLEATGETSERQYKSI
ncbi:orc1/cdc6 family replication initiation protein [Haloferax elongans ATCC BAA-1513]|uniref:Orc1/cdc6 family replication initiation protein n=1 Tax=Haloferax elongans ATCC BAA-1513 TaxID=1230453 RepID=M0HIQ4_HALEO|nr:Cdc6/Cdc18 family protein [Haloferax elongans]ELZ84430.1 orc1/cdc6 family replication initiation protein [Haloferax elongans ATCC BAA-1513]